MMSRKGRGKALVAQELMAHIPDLVLHASKKVKTLPVVQHLEGVLMFLDISGFTALCEEFNKRNLGVDALTKSLNDYLGHIEDAILKRDGDIIEFAGDAVLVVWQSNEDTAREAVAKAVRCARQIQKQCHNWKTDVGVLLGVKVAISHGPISVSFVGNANSQHFSTSGQAVEDANSTEKLCEKGSIVLNSEAWKLCPEKKGVITDKLDDDHYKIMALKKSWAEKELYRDDTKLKKKKSTTSKTLSREPPVRSFSVKAAQKVNMRPYIATPVLRKVDENQPLEYLCEMREVSILFINLHLESGYEHLHSLQNVFDRVEASVLQFQGLINKIFEFDKGTSFLVLFGLPGFKHEDEISHALQCAAQIRKNVNALVEVKQVSIGVTTGKVFCGVVGHPERHEYTVIGPKVNMAARLMMNYPSMVSCDSHTKRHSKFDGNYFKELPEVSLKGVADTGKIYEYQEISGSQTFRITESKYPMLGYVEDFLECINMIEVVIAKRLSSKPTPKFIILEGDSGVGKTRFLRALMDVSLKNSMRVVCTQSSIGTMTTPYHTICSLLTEILRLGNITQAQEKERHLQDRFRNTHLMKYLSLLNNLLGIQLPANPAVRDLKTEDRSQALHSLLGQVVRETRKKSEVGTLIAIDDAHYIDSDSWTYLKDLVGDTTLIAFIVGPQSRDKWSEDVQKIMADPQTRKAQLKGLDPSCMEPLLCQLLEVARVPRELTNMLTAHLKGRLNPSWVKQCVFNLLHHNQLEIVTRGRRPECVVTPGVRLMELQIPDSLRGCMIAFIDRLPEVERVAVKIASIIGTAFTDEDLCHLMHHTSPDKVRKTIGELLSAGVLMFENGLIRFQSLTLQETAYTLLVEKLRRKLHERYALYLERKYLEVDKIRKKKKSKQQKSKTGSKKSGNFGNQQ
ncbi:Adenylate cyclase type 10 [Holothuria leucospilota]|uniref:Adenylate cyclase type 10 n=1 Tax=Holothuria leucospilota TaxID=206669 RepID=A0A9Q1BKF0_HOLLE|nr:Adenylate cyclase type 10 [Holothuria leucospilota]